VVKQSFWKGFITHQPEDRGPDPRSRHPRTLDRGPDPHAVGRGTREIEKRLDARHLAFFADLECDTRGNSAREREREAADGVDEKKRISL